MNFFLKKNINKPKCLLTLSTCWYILKSKFDNKTYVNWIKNLMSIVNNFNLVIYTDKESFIQIYSLINLSNTRIKIIIKPFEEFYTYKYRNDWITNHKKSNLNLHNHIDWKLNMLWNEKVFFVNETIQNKYYDTLYYGWTDIGYFRNRLNDLHIKYLLKWPNNDILNNHFNNNYIHYGCVQNDSLKYLLLSKEIKNHYINKNIVQPSINYEDTCFAGGFFILKPNVINIYTKLYDEKLAYYFKNNYIIKDDQTIIMDIVFTNEELFYIHTENMTLFDNWFMFQRILN
jgi:hypothetical protein